MADKPEDSHAILREELRMLRRLPFTIAYERFHTLVTDSMHGETIEKLRQHIDGYCGEGATPGCFTAMRALLSEIANE